MLVLVMECSCECLDVACVNCIELYVFVFCDIQYIRLDVDGVYYLHNFSFCLCYS